VCYWNIVLVPPYLVVRGKRDWEAGNETKNATFFSTVKQDLRGDKGLWQKTGKMGIIIVAGKSEQLVTRVRGTGRSCPNRNKISPELIVAVINQRKGKVGGRGGQKAHVVYLDGRAG